MLAKKKKKEEWLDPLSARNIFHRALRKQKSVSARINIPRECVCFFFRTPDVIGSYYRSTFSQFDVISPRSENPVRVERESIREKSPSDSPAMAREQPRKHREKERSVEDTYRRNLNKQTNPRELGYQT